MSNILVIEDDVYTRTVIRQMIEREGHNVLEAANGEDGIRVFRENRIDLTVTDILMPEKDGITTIFELKKLSPSVKIIAMSGGGRLGPETYIKLAQKMGSDSTLTKPIERTKLTAAIGMLLGQ